MKITEPIYLKNQVSNQSGMEIVEYIKLENERDCTIVEFEEKNKRTYIKIETKPYTPYYTETAIHTKDCEVTTKEIFLNQYSKALVFLTNIYTKHD